MISTRPNQVEKQFLDIKMAQKNTDKSWDQFFSSKNEPNPRSNMYQTTSYKTFEAYEAACKKREKMVKNKHEKKGDDFVTPSTYGSSGPRGGERSSM
jgi:hypothetical protein